MDHDSGLVPWRASLERPGTPPHWWLLLLLLLLLP
jgi:hypothetical protein